MARQSMTARRVGLASLLALVVLAMPVEGHSAPNPAEDATRLLADWQDDCGGDGGAATGGCRGSHDLLALDVLEARDPQLGDVVVFRLFADAGRGYPITDTLLLDAGGTAKTMAVTTQDGVR